MKRTIYLTSVSGFVCCFIALGLTLAKRAPASDHEALQSVSDLPVTVMDPLEASLAIVPAGNDE
jgi:hypothetical protein